MVSMKFERFIAGLKSLDRILEVLRCFRQSRSPLSEFLAYLQVRALEYPHEVRLRDGSRLVVNDWEDLTTAWVVFYGNEYTVRPNDKIIVDLGANVGAFSLRASVLAANARVVAVEPFPGNFARLQQTIHMNELSGRVMPMDVAVVGEAGDVIMDDSPSIPSHSRRVGADAGVAVRGITLSDLMEELQIDSIDLLKVDIEGGEYELFSGIETETLQKVKRIGMEYHGNGDTSELFARLSKAGFTIFRYPKRGTAGVVEFERS